MVLIPTGAGGSIAVEDLGRTLMHEHLFVLTPEVLENYPEYWDEEERVDAAVAQLTRLKAAGIDSIVDPTVIGLGRYLPRVRRIAERVPVNIIVATGVYAFVEMPHFFRYRGPGTLLGGPEFIADLLVKDIQVGIGDTDVKAAFLKCATEHPDMSADVERVLRATALAHLQTGAPIMTHSNALLQTGLIQQEIFAEEGVDLTQVLIGHCGDTTDESYLRRLLDRGSFIGLDRFGLDQLLPTAKRVDTLVRLCELGYADQIVVSHDASCHTDAFPDDMRNAAMPDWHFEYIPRVVLPMLRKRGLAEEVLDQILVDNPRRYFEALQGDR